MDGECKKSRMKRSNNKLVSLVSSLNIGSKEFSIESVCNWQEREIVDVEYNTAELVDLAWGKNHLGLDLIEGPMDGNDVDNRPTPIVKLPQACEYAQLLSKVCSATSSTIFDRKDDEHAISYR